MTANSTRIQDMSQPVRCNRCYTGVYDLGTVEVVQRYLDCSVWRTPCCGQLVDDRGETGWTSRCDYQRLNNANQVGRDGSWRSR